MITQTLKWIAAASVLCLALTGCTSNAVQTVGTDTQDTVGANLSEPKLDSASLNQATPQHSTVGRLGCWVLPGLGGCYRREF